MNTRHVLTLAITFALPVATLAQGSGKTPAPKPGRKSTASYASRRHQVD